MGDIIFDKPIEDSVKLEILSKRFIPGKGWKGTLRQFGKTKRRVPSSIFDDMR